MYFCPIGCREEPFDSPSELKDHIGNHLPGAPAGQIQAMVLLGEKPGPDDSTNECPLCKYTLIGFKRYIKHVGRHLEQLALFALPDLEGGLEDADKDQDGESLASPSYSSGQISSDAEDRPDSPSGHQVAPGEEEPDTVSNSIRKILTKLVNQSDPVKSGNVKRVLGDNGEHMDSVIAEIQTELQKLRPGSALQTVLENQRELDVPPQNFPPFSVPPSDFATPSSATVAHDEHQNYVPSTSEEDSEQHPQANGELIGGRELVDQFLRKAAAAMDRRKQSTTEAPGVNHNSAYQTVGNHFNMYDDIYSANVQLPTPNHDVYSKNLAQQPAAFNAADLGQSRPADLPAIGLGNAMLDTSQSYLEVDEGFDQLMGSVVEPKEHMPTTSEDVPRFKVKDASGRKRSFSFSSGQYMGGTLAPRRPTHLPTAKPKRRLI